MATVWRVDNLYGFTYAGLRAGYVATLTLATD